MKKNILLGLIAGTLLFSCSKTDIQQANNTIKSADSLFRSANNGFRTLDSLSKIVQDSAKMNKIIVPEIHKTKETVEKVIVENAKTLDSINSVIKNSTEQIKRSQEVISSVDSATEELKNSKNPIEIISTISKTIDKVSKQAKNKSSSKKNNTESSNSEKNINENSKISEEKTFSDPLVKSLKTEITVENINDANTELYGLLEKYDAEIVSDNFGEQNGYRRQSIQAKIPYAFFDEFSSAISQNFGTVKSKNTDVQGSDYNANQMCDLEIIFTENRQFSGSESFSTDNAEKTPDSTEKTFLEKFGIAGIIIAVALVLIPLMLLILYLMNRNMKKKMENQFQQQNQNRQSYPQQNFQNEIKQEPKQEPKDNNEDPYEKYRPK